MLKITVPATSTSADVAGNNPQGRERSSPGGRTAEQGRTSRADLPGSLGRRGVILPRSRPVIRIA